MWNESRKDMGINIDCTATDKALYESPAELHELSVSWSVNWKEIIEWLYEVLGHISRLDIAIDLINYGFSVNETIQQSIKNRLF